MSRLVLDLTRRSDGTTGVNFPNTQQAKIKVLFFPAVGPARYVDLIDGRSFGHLMNATHLGLISWGDDQYQCKLMYSKTAKQEGRPINSLVNEVIPNLNLSGDMMLTLFKGGREMVSMSVLGQGVETKLSVESGEWKKWFDDLRPTQSGINPYATAFTGTSAPSQW